MQKSILLERIRLESVDCLEKKGKGTEKTETWKANILLVQEKENRLLSYIH